jgi:hypothetical protein
MSSLSESIRQSKPTPDELASIKESRAVLNQCGETLWQIRPFDHAHKDVAPCYDAYCEAGDRFRANPTTENAQAVIAAKKAMDEAPVNRNIIRDVLQPTIDSHHNRLGEIALGILDRVIIEVESGFEKRITQLEAKPSPTSSAEVNGLKQALQDIRHQAATQRKNLASVNEGAPWLEQHDF